MEDNFDDMEHRRLTEASISAFLEEEGVPMSRRVTVEDVMAAPLALGCSVATASASFAARVALLRLDCLTSVNRGTAQGRAAHELIGGEPDCG
ncbi:hypothetical protein LSCM4_04926 [Leishmania orientalis]|uniref:Uncharacterized protein n=1 Tax=Leishmania orientalis TaxID=2249476 RepID=A0A836KS99_9TRYP|nr:hypothetical protein LSCM4_04926 [Leishmania orientalis]